jgi:hypothetical protein
MIVGHTQSHAKVRVGTKVSLDDTRRALGGEDEVEAE